MIRHAFLLVWHRKRANALLILELLVTFLVLFALAAFSLNFYRLYRQPLGFEVANMMSVRITTGGGLTELDRATFQQVLRVVEQTADVESVEIMNDALFYAGGSATRMQLGGRDVRVEVNDISMRFPDTVGMTLVQGRWFGPQDEVQADAAPVLVNRVFAGLAGGEVLGTVFPIGDKQKYRVIGIFDDFRQHGDFTTSRPFMMRLSRPDDEFSALPLIVVKSRTGTDDGFEERLLDVLQRAAPGWDFDADTWTALQQSHYRAYMIPMTIVGCIVGFLLLLVGFGLLGVLWQNVIRRTPEIGLRRAMGATASTVRLQVVLELLAVLLIALVLGLVITAQFPLAGVIRQLDWGLFAPSAIVSTVVLLCLCILFALYPSWQATRMDPVDALRYE